MNASYTIIPRSWIFRQLTPILAPQFVSESPFTVVNDPPFNRRRDNLSGIIRRWQPAAPYRQKLAKTVFPAVVIPGDAPPIGRRSYPAAISRTWEFYQRATAFRLPPTIEIVQPGAVIIIPPIIVPPFIPPIIVPPQATARPFESTHLEDSKSYGAVEMGSGPFGGTKWTEGSPASTEIQVTQSSGYGSGGYGAFAYGAGPTTTTIVVVATAVAAPFRSTHLESSADYGAVEMGSGPFGNTKWTRS